MQIQNGLLEPAFEALVALGQLQVPADTVGVPAARARRALRAALQDVGEAREAVARRHAETGDDGEPRTEPVEGQPEMQRYVIEDAEACERELRELFAGTSEVDATPIPLDALGQATVPGHQLDLLIECGLLA